MGPGSKKVKPTVRAAGVASPASAPKPNVRAMGVASPVSEAKPATPRIPTISASSPVSVSSATQPPANSPWTRLAGAGGKVLGAASRVAGPVGLARSVMRTNAANTLENEELNTFLGPRGENGVRRGAQAATTPSAPTPEAPPEAEIAPTVVTARRQSPAASRPTARPASRSTSADRSADTLNAGELARIKRVNAGEADDRKPSFSRGGMPVKSGKVPAFLTKATPPKSGFPDFTKGSPVKAAAPKAAPPKAKSPATKAPAKTFPFNRGGMAKKGKC